LNQVREARKVVFIPQLKKGRRIEEEKDPAAFKPVEPA